MLVAINAWGDGFDTFLARLRAQGVDDWRIRQCGDAATAVALAREHDHVAFVTASTAAPDLRAKWLRPIALSGMPRWTVRLDLVHRTPDRDDPTIQLLTQAM